MANNLYIVCIHVESLMKTLILPSSPWLQCNFKCKFYKNYAVIHCFSG